MDYTPLGKTGVLVSNLCFGTMSFGGEADAEESAKMYRACREAGVNFFDCANVYNQGRSEEILGDLIQSERDEIVITSKYTVRSGPDVNAIGASRRNAVCEVEKSLKRLKTDRIDLYFVHNWDPLTAIDETLRGLDDLVRQGKILYIGVSNWAAWQIAKALGLQFHYGWSPVTCIEPMYNLLKRQAEAEILPLAQSEGLGVITYGPLAGGLLTGRYSGGKRPDSSRFAERRMYTDRYGSEEYYLAADKFVAYASQHKLNPVTLAVAWTGANPAVTAPIFGARNHQQMQASLAAADLELSPEMYAEISKIFPSPPPTHDRTEELVDPGYRLRG